LVIFVNTGVNAKIICSCLNLTLVLAEGFYFYDSKANMLIGVLAGDIRGATGTQPFVKDAPVNLLFVADFAKMGNAPDDQKEFYVAIDTG
jgi:hypothetical protein